MRQIFSKLLLASLMFGCLILTSCKKEKVTKDEVNTQTSETTPDQTTDPDPEPVSPFIGTYDLEVVTDSLSSDGTWISREFYESMTGKHEGPFYGRLTITQENASTFKIIGKVLVGTDSMEYYNTTAVLDANGNLLPEPSTLVSDFTHHFTYGPIALQNPLVFRTERHVPTYKMDWGYIMTNTATKRQ